MSIRVSGVYLVPSPGGGNDAGNDKPGNLGVEASLHHQQHHHHHHSTTKTVTIVAAPQRSNSLDYLNFEEKRQIIASSLSLSDFLAHGPAAAAAAAKEVAANTVIAKKQNGAALRTNSLGSGARTPPLERKSKFSALGRLFKPWKWKRKKKSDKFEAASLSLERKISVRASRDELVQKGILLPVIRSTSFPENVEKGVLDQSADNQQVIERCYPLPPQNTLMLSELPEPPIPLSEIGPIPPPPMFSSPSPTLLARQRQIPLSDCEDEDEEDVDVEEEDDNMYVFRVSQPDPAIDTSRVEEIPAKEPKFHAVPLKSVLKKRGSGSGPGTPQNTPTQENRPLTLRQELQASFKRPPLRPRMRICSRPVRFGLALPCTLENKENARPYVIREDADGDSGDGQVLYREDYDDEKRPARCQQRLPLFSDRSSASRATRTLDIINIRNEVKERIDPDRPSRLSRRETIGDGKLCRLAAKIARKESLSLKLALRPDRQELINRNILQLQTDNERQETKEAIGAKLIRRLSMRPTQEELEERNILKKQSPAEEKKQKEEKKRYLLRKLSFRPTVEELKEKKIIRFNDYIEVTQAHDYDRRADKPWTRLTPKDKAAIRKELNEFKSSEMAVHEDSRHLTRFHRP
ncbi:PREDICTED: phosphatase and actin regulator 4 isoform X8 [Dinoponera quadriceps]|uniref:Phosphatase and actin regulator 4 isoform X8 n=1 Tax=Dinoponera quadriceps TaxID=609295 RepID=A0A6P3Y030_DINQU|nr:PREDICTED: phosphatase and actin regulator 4 isoform X8 [Dinoponera quadriceps]